MLHITDRIENFIALGDWLKASLKNIEEDKKNDLSAIIEKAGIENPWFTKTAVINSLHAIASWLDRPTIHQWIEPYFLSDPPQIRKVAVIMAGNIPLVNFHDFLCVLISGHQFLGKLSSQDKVLLPFIGEKLIQINPLWKNSIFFTDERLDNFEAVIATGSNNSARYFEYYFGKYPHIIRKNRQSIAVLSGTETDEELKAIYTDIFQYYGMGCRNISMLLVPKDYNFPALFEKWEGLAKPTEHNKYLNNYDYYRSFYLVNQQPFYDTGYASVLQNSTLSSPISVIHYTEYADNEMINNFIKEHLTEIQCVVSHKTLKEVSTVLPGQTQFPGLHDYPDGVDIIQFLLAL